MKTVRRFSMAGPCIVLGEVVRETEHFYFYQRYEVGLLRPVVHRVKKDGERLVHSAPCVSCRDHEQTQYPRGYED